MFFGVVQHRPHVPQFGVKVSMPFAASLYSSRFAICVGQTIAFLAVTIGNARSSSNDKADMFEPSNWPDWRTMKRGERNDNMASPIGVPDKRAV